MLGYLTDLLSLLFNNEAGDTKAPLKLNTDKGHSLECLAERGTARLLFDVEVSSRWLAQVQVLLQTNKGLPSVQAEVIPAFDVRDDYARMYNVPPFRVIGNRDLLEIARDFNYVNRLHFSTALGINAIKELMSDLKAAVGISKRTN